MKKALLILMVLVVGIGAAAVDVLIDGKFDDWAELSPAASDTVGDILPADIADFIEFKITNDDQNLYVNYKVTKMMDWNTQGHLYCVFIDGDNNNKTGYRGFDGKWFIGSELLIQGGTLFRFKGNTQMIWDWENKGLQTYGVGGVDNCSAEIAAPLLELNLKKMDEIKILLYGDNKDQKDFVPDKYYINFISYTIK